MTETKLRSDQPSSMAERISNRLKNSGDTANADVVPKTGDSARRTFHNIHNPGSAKRHGPSASGEGDVSGRPR